LYQKIFTEVIMKILVTGGAGYIGSHTCLELLNAGHEVVVVDNLSNSKKESLERVEELTSKTIQFYEVDINERAALEEVFANEKVDAVIHFAAFKAVGESVANPLAYYENNVGGTITLCQTMEKYGVQKMVFSSSATVYGLIEEMPLKEDAPLSAINPYGMSKVMMEHVFQDVHHANPNWQIALLRYFNPVGAHESGIIGEDPNGIPNNLLPYITQVAVGKREKLSVWGNDYPTPDGTGVRDYIHVVDLAKGHLKALDVLQEGHGCEPYNLGTGEGYSVLDVIKAFEEASGITIPYQIAERRPGDLATSYADPSKAKNVLGWEAEKTLLDMCADAWRWQSKNPNGYES
jgi:UDP-glucose 4-epimerase